ncbi:response regulator [bacterium]|nr:response regulator [bacterium]
MKNVLIIDDEVELLEPLSLGLEQLSDRFNYITTADPIDGMVILDTKPIEVLVTDMIMPYITGLDIIEQVIRHFPHTACILMTAYGSPDIEIILSEYSVNYVEKPLDLDQLHRMIINVSKKPRPEAELKQVILPTFIRVLAAKELTCRVDIECLHKKQKGVLYFSRGELFHAKLSGMSPEEAAVVLLTCVKAKVTIHQPKRPFRRKIYKGLEELLHISADNGRDIYALVGSPSSGTLETRSDYAVTQNLIRLLSAGVTLKYNLLDTKK